MFTTGEFSRIARVSRRTLRHYREIGLFEPLHSDPENGYHYYSASQLPDLHRILALRDLGFTLEQIQNVSAVSVDEMRGMLLMKKSEVEKTLLEELQRIRAIESRLQLLGSDRPHYEVVIKQIPQQAYYAATYRCHSPEHGLQVTQQVRQSIPASVSANALGHMITRLQADEFADFTFDDVEVEVGFLLVSDVTVPPLSLNGLDFSRRTLEPVDKMASVVITGMPETWNQASTAIGEWMETNGYRLAGYQREIWLDMQPEPVIELQMPVQHPQIKERI